MRTIKFRGKSKLDGRWLYGDLFRTDLDGEVSIQFYDEEDGWMSAIVRPETVGQFTSIKDGNGTEIFEGDIIEVTLRYNNAIVSTYNAIVDQKEGAFGFNNKQGFCPFYGQIHENYKVIGNIHDNPELLEGGQQ